jgi:drug/metabolite transporter (DMT)-like permease
MQGMIYMLLASTSFATMAAMVKAMGSGVPIAQLIFLRCFIPLPFFVVIILKKKKPLIVTAKKLLLARAFLGAAAMGCFYYALTHMPLADCIFLGKSQPLLLAVLAPFIVQEKATKETWIAIGSGLIGVLLIMKPAMAWQNAGLVALGGAFFAAFAHLMVRKLNRYDNPYTIVFNFFACTAVLTLVASMFTDIVMPDSSQWLLIGGIALFASLGQFLMTLAYRCEIAPVVAASSYASIVLSVVYGYLFWGEIPHRLALAGAACLLVGSGVLAKSRAGLKTKD